MQKTGDIHLASEKGRCVAYWRPADGSPDVVLCAADLSTCDRIKSQAPLEPDDNFSVT